MLQVRDLLESAYHATEQPEIDVVICRYANQSAQKPRKKSIDSYLNDAEDGQKTNGEFSEFASTALK